MKKHGMYRTRIYSIWEKMKARCDNPSETGYKDYGGRGIVYCDEWKSFENFYADMSLSYFEKAYLDRINPNGNYSKENCRWVDASMNAYNQRIRKTNKSGKTGISYSKSNNKWRATITKNKKSYHLGYYTSVEEASEARKCAELELFGETKE